ncbi:MAG: rRNA maturation RNase YbeY [Lachnospiraceae bacterium]|nr:rRNA maturation RNase YbeY [Lachnospiraceae bacterium]
MTILMENEVDASFDFEYEKLLEEVIIQALDYEKCPYECEINLTFTDDDGIRIINSEFRGLDIPTDVLSFPMVEYETPADFENLDSDENFAMYFNPESGELLLGDIVISVERAKLQAKEYGHSLKREICFLTAHSMLHLMGYDHMTDDERVIMEKKQDDILNILGITRD